MPYWAGKKHMDRLVESALTPVNDVTPERHLRLVVNNATVEPAKRPVGDLKISEAADAGLQFVHGLFMGLLGSVALWLILGAVVTYLIFR